MCGLGACFIMHFKAKKTRENRYFYDCFCIVFLEEYVKADKVNFGIDIQCNRP